MSQSGEIADIVVKEGIQVTEEAAKLAALGAKNLAAIVMALLKEDNKTHGMTSMKKLIKSEKPLSILQISKEDLPKFKKEAKKYGVLFTAISDKDGKSDFVDIIARQDDVPQLNHIIDKLELNAPKLSEKTESEEKTSEAPDKDTKNPVPREKENPSDKRYTVRAGVKKEDLEEGKESVKDKIQEIKATKKPTPDKAPDLVRASRKASDKLNRPKAVVKAKVKNAAKEVTSTAKKTVQASRADKQKER